MSPRTMPVCSRDRPNGQRHDEMAPGGRRSYTLIMISVFAKRAEGREEVDGLLLFFVFVEATEEEDCDGGGLREESAGDMAAK